MTSLDNETIRIILGRRSVRVFEARSVEAEKVDLILECAFAAPSAMNIQPCHVVVVNDKDLLKKIGEASAHSRMAAGAPLGLAVCVDVADYEKKHNFTDGTWRTPPVSWRTCCWLRGPWDWKASGCKSPTVPNGREPFRPS